MEPHDCRHLLGDLSDYLDGQASTELCAEIERHLEDCANCRVVIDTLLVADTPACRIDDTLGPHPFYQFATGIQSDTRYAITKVSYNDQFGIFTQQSLDDRRVQDGEPYWLVW